MVKQLKREPLRKINAREILDLVLAGHSMMVAEYRNGKAEDISWRDKTTKEILEGVAAGHSIETANDSLRLLERTPDGYSIADFEPLCAKGTRIAIDVTQRNTFKGATSVTGEVYEYME